jgi:hypothetical protein
VRRDEGGRWVLVRAVTDGAGDAAGLADLGGQVAGVVDRLVRAQTADELGLLTGRAVAMTFAPATAAYWIAIAPTPPVAPLISTVSPACGATASSASTAAVPASSTAPAATTSTPSGSFAMPTSSGTVTYSPNPPSPRYAW